MESWVKTLNNYKSCLYLTIPQFLQSIRMFPRGMFHASTCFFFKSVKPYSWTPASDHVKKNLKKIEREWFNLDLEPKLTFQGNQGCDVLSL